MTPHSEHNRTLDAARMPEGYLEYQAREAIRYVLTAYGSAGARIKINEWLANEIQETRQ